MNVSLLGFVFFICGVFQLASAKTAAPILMLNTSNGVFPCKDVPFMDPVNDAPHLGGHVPKNCPKRGMNRQFWVQLQKSLNFDIIKITEPIRTKFCPMIKTTTNTSHLRVTQMADGCHIGNMIICSNFAAVTGLDELLHGHTDCDCQPCRKLKSAHFGNSRWRTFTVLKIENSQYLCNCLTDHDEILHKRIVATNCAQS